MLSGARFEAGIEEAGFELVPLQPELASSDSVSTGITTGGLKSSRLWFLTWFLR